MRGLAALERSWNAFAGASASRGLVVTAGAARSRPLVVGAWMPNKAGPLASGWGLFQCATGPAKVMSFGMRRFASNSSSKQPPPTKNPYKILGLQNDATSQQIKSTYLKLAQQFHPDLNQEEGAKERFSQINKAYKILSDDFTRTAYDAGRMDEYGDIDREASAGAVARHKRKEARRMAVVAAAVAARAQSKKSSNRDSKAGKGLAAAAAFAEAAAAKAAAGKGLSAAEVVVAAEAAVAADAAAAAASKVHVASQQS